ncbi:MAG: polysaccharide deacetylase family protein [Opitutae bacterium]|nr:polysaccharide deacetylase family protein [Opitutae bacterium]
MRFFALSPLKIRPSPNAGARLRLVYQNTIRFPLARGTRHCKERPAFAFTQTASGLARLFQFLKPPVMKIVQCWDDGVVDDIRLCSLLRARGARATFNLNYGLHGAGRGHAWVYQQTKVVQRLALAELHETYLGFTIANHTLTHPFPSRLSLSEWRREVTDGRAQLQDHFQQEVSGFAYPYGEYDDALAEVVRDAGHVYARTCRNATPCLPADDNLMLATDCHHADPAFWERYGAAKAARAPVFYFWGHSYEFMTESDWADFDAKMQRISADPDVQWADLPELFNSSARNRPTF